MRSVRQRRRDKTRYPPTLPWWKDRSLAYEFARRNYHFTGGDRRWAAYVRFVATIERRNTRSGWNCEDARDAISAAVAHERELFEAHRQRRIAASEEHVAAYTDADWRRLRRISRVSIDYFYCPPSIQFNVHFVTHNARGWPCGNCGRSKSEHHFDRPSLSPECYNTDRGFVKSRCGCYESPCAVCNGASYTANATRVCITCQRILNRIKRKVEKQRWLQVKAERKQAEDLVGFLRGGRKLRKLSRWLSQRRSQSVAAGSAPERTSQTS